MKTEDELMDHADDSSDEEDEGIVLNTEDVIEKWEKFESSDFFSDYKFLVKNSGQSLRNFFFILYLGVGLFHAPSVQDYYRRYKKVHLSKSYLEKNGQSLKYSVKEGITAAIFQIFKIEGFKKNKKVEQKLQSFIDNNADLINQIADELTANQRQLFRGTNFPSALEENFESLKFLRNKLLKLINTDVVVSYKLSKNRMQFVYDGRQKIVNDCITDEIIRYINELVNEAHAHVSHQPNLLALHEFLKDMEENEEEEHSESSETEDEVDEENTEKEDNEETSNEDDSIDELEIKQLRMTILEKLNDIEENLTPDKDPRVSLKVNEFVEQYKKDLLIAKINDIEKQEEYDGSLNTCLWQLVNNPTLREEARVQLKKYLVWSPERIKARLIKNLDTDYYFCVAKNLRQRIKSKLNRSFLPRNHIFNSTNEISFLGNLRTSNRSQHRMVRHLIATEQSGGDLIRLKWLFANTLTYEDQEINENLARIDLVTPLGPYASIYKKITELKNNLDCDDAYIAQMLRDILCAKPDVFKDFAVGHEKKAKYESVMVSLTYLLFGTEVVRNPGSLILQQMMLDLIIAGKMSWEKALNNKKLAFGGGGDMPMSMNEEPVASCRWLVNIFSNYLPRHYHYAGEPQSLDNNGLKSIKELLRRNTFLINMWTEYESKRLDKDPITSAEDILDLIIGKIKNDWFKNISASTEEEPDEIVINDSDLEDADEADHNDNILEFEDSNEETDEDNEQNSDSESSTDHSF